MGFSTPSTGKACGASPLTLGCARHGRPLHRTPLGYGDTPLAALLSEGCPHVLSSGSTVQIASTPHPIVFSKAGKTILDPSTRTVHSPPELNQWPPIPACNYRGSRLPLHRQSLRSLPLIKRKRRRGRTSRATGSAHLPVYQAGGPPLDFEKTGLPLFGLRGSMGFMGHVHKAVPSLSRACIVRGQLRKARDDSGTNNEAPLAKRGGWGE